MMKPGCHECKHRRDVPGSAHSKCAHPKVASSQTVSDPFAEILSILGSVGRSAPVMAVDAAAELGIIGHPHGIRYGWFNWPWNFDPAWLENCSGFEKKEETD